LSIYLLKARSSPCHSYSSAACIWLHKRRTSLLSPSLLDFRGFYTCSCVALANPVHLRRLIILSILYLRIQSNYIRISSSGTAIVPVILFQEIYLGYSLMSATIPCLKSFVQGFTTGGVGYERDESWLFSTSSSGDRFKMRSIAKKLPLPTLPSEPLPMPRPARFPSLRLQDSIDTTEGGRSLRSQGSQQPMIWEAR
jgi:hypothetical protein